MARKSRLRSFFARARVAFLELDMQLWDAARYCVSVTRRFGRALSDSWDTVAYRMELFAWQAAQASYQRLAGPADDADRVSGVQSATGAWSDHDQSAAAA